VVLWAVRSTFLPPPVAYGKPAPIDPTYFKRRTRGIVLSSLAGPGANLLVAALASVVLRAHLSTPLERFFVALEFANLCLCFFHLLPIPGLDGARMVALLLPPNIAGTYRNADKYLPLFVLVLLFVFAGPILAIVYSLTNAVCGLFSGTACNVRALLAP
jgi:Zn-dependent protease